MFRRDLKPVLAVPRQVGSVQSVNTVDVDVTQFLPCQHLEFRMGRGRRGERQSYDSLRSHHRQLGVPWTDNSFPANDSSIGLQKVSPERTDHQ